MNFLAEITGAQSISLIVALALVVGAFGLYINESRNFKKNSGDVLGIILGAFAGAAATAVAVILVLIAVIVLLIAF